jgi:CRP/FNR family transcriptional regulator
MRVPPCFKGISERHVRELLTRGETRRYRRGEIIVRQGDPEKHIVLVLEGSVKLSRLADDGREQAIQLLGSGDCYCLAPAFLHTHSPVAAQCLSAVTVLKVNPGRFHALGADARVAAGVVRCLAQRVERLTALVESLSTRDVRSRLARLLLALATEREGVPAQEGIMFGRALTHHELAACVGTAREVVSRLLAEFRRHEAIRNQGRRLVIAARERLERIASGPLPSRGAH